MHALEEAAGWDTAGWHAERVVTTLRVTDTIEVLQYWSVVADAVVDELVIDLALGEDDTVGVLYGAELVTRTRCPDNPAQGRVVVRLPDPILPGDTHGWALFSTVASASRSVYLDIASVPCAVLDLRVKFLAPRIPTSVWRLDDIQAPGTTWPLPTGCPSVPVVYDGEVEMRFTGLRTRHGYGVAWQR